MLSPAFDQKLSVTIAQHSAVGRKASNQDFYGAIVPDDSLMVLKGVALAVADGISTSTVSGEAAETAVKEFLTDYYCASDAWTVKTAGQRVISATNAWLHSQSRLSHGSEDRDQGYVCTFSAAVIKGRQAHIFQIGDSRISRIAGESLEQLTNEHRIVLASKESYLGRALGLHATVDIDYRAIELRVGDILVLTTDGIHEHVSGHELAKCILASEDLDVAVRNIVETAQLNGSQDDLTIQIVRIDTLPARTARSVIHEAETLPPPPIPKLRSIFEGFRIVRQLHASSRSHVFLAHVAETNERVVLKIPSMDMREDQGYLRRFAMEEWIARRIDSQHVLKAAQLRENRDFLYTVTEFVEGQTLRQWMRDNPQPTLEVVRDLAEQLAKGLRAFHRKDMLHQDLRPENVMIDDEGTIKIIDFGAVRIAGVLEAAPDRGGNEILGTHQYAAPEYFIGLEGSERSDLYSLAVIVYEMLTGRLPYDARMARANTRFQQSRVTYTSLCAYRRDLPAWLDDSLKKALQPDPTKRQQALSEFAHDLRHPRPGFLTRGPVPFAERNPVLFWKLISLFLALTLVGLALWKS